MTLTITNRDGLADLSGDLHARYAALMDKPTVHAATETPNAHPLVISLRNHTFRADLSTAGGGEDSAPGPHDYFDAALAACKSLTATWYAKKNNLPLERVEVDVERDDSREREGHYTLRVKIALHGAALSDADKKRILGAVSRCPVHKLMTTTEIAIETVEV